MVTPWTPLESNPDVLTPYINRLGAVGVNVSDVF
ncbi:hypothetical protein KIPB_009038, partial [Kipferlia bialata]|eukprot:g9038.t1